MSLTIKQLKDMNASLQKCQTAILITGEMLPDNTANAENHFYNFEDGFMEKVFVAAMLKDERFADFIYDVACAYSVHKLYDGNTDFVLNDK